MSLNWSDERYVRLFVRDTPHWVLGPWEARAVLGPVLRKLDRSGVLDLSDDGLDALAAVVAMPLEVVEAGMAWWIKKGTFEIVDGRLVMPNFLDAQEAAASDAQRARESRARARAKARTSDANNNSDDRDVEKDSDTKRDGPITNRDERSRNVSGSSHAVTGSHSVPSVLCRTVPISPPSSAVLTLTGEPTIAKAKKKAKHTTEEIASKNRLVACFEAGVEAKKGIKPTLNVGDHAAAFALVKKYGADEACSIVRRALEDRFVLTSSTTLRYVASKPDTWRGNAPAKSNAAHPAIARVDDEGAQSPSRVRLQSPVVPNRGASDVR